MKPRLGEVAAYLYPGRRVIIVDDADGAGPKWLDQNVPEPSDADYAAACAAIDKASGNAATVAQITALEATTLRAMREFILGDATATARLKAVNDQIVALRSKLQ